MNACKHLLLLLLIILQASLGKAQSYYFRNYQISKGLSSNFVSSILQDKKGFMWFGTRNGLNRFNGTSFEVFKNDVADSFSIGNNAISGITENENGELWIGTYEGVYIYDPITERFRKEKKILQERISSIMNDGRNIWVSAIPELCRYNILTKNVKVYKTENVVAITKSKEKAIWIATITGALKRYNAATDEFTQLSVDSSYKPKITDVREIYVVNDSLLMVATVNQALLVNTKTGGISNVFKGSRWESDIRVNKIIHQSEDEFWLGSENGIYILRLSGRSFHLIQKEYGVPYSISDNVIKDLFKDKEGNTWVGTLFGGIDYYSSQLNQFRRYYPSLEKNSISGNLVHDICGDQNGHLWIGTEDAGLNKFDPATGIFKQYMPGKEKGTLVYHNIHGLLVDGNKLWIGTYDHGLDVMDLRTERIIRNYQKGPNSFKNNFVVTIYKTRAGEILVGTIEGLFKYDKDRDNFSSFLNFNHATQAIYEALDNTLWICSYGSGIYYINPLTGISGSFHHDANDIHSLTSDYVNNIFEDSKQNIWFCTETGLCRLDAKSGKIIRSDIPVLKKNQIFRILEDKAGLLWVSSSQGLISLDAGANVATVYNTYNGLLTEQFNYNSGFKDSLGNMYFGSLKGMISFTPQKFNKNMSVPDVYITGIQINNKEVNVRTEKTPLTNSVIYTHDIELPYDQSTISFDVNTLSYIVPELNEYRYKMDGYDKEWVSLKTNRKIYYTKLPPGSYTFRLQGSNNDRIWNQKETILNISITSPYWATNWAYLIYIAVAAGILLLIMRYYFLALREKNKRKMAAFQIEKEREIHHAKIDFFTNMAHEIRTPLTLIKMPLDKVIKRNQLHPEDIKSLLIMKRNTNKLIDLTNQLLDFRKTEANNFSLSFTKNNINELIEESFQNLKTAADEREVEYILELPRISLTAYIDAGAFRKILDNVFGNAIKYCDKRVKIKLMPFGSEDAVFNIIVKNDGFLIPYEQREKIFEPFYRLKQTEDKQGSGIGLALSRSLAELHKGVLEFQRSEDGLNTFALTIPIHQDREIVLSENDIENKEAGQGSHTTVLHDPVKNNILLVEDNEEIVNFIADELKGDYNIFISYNGKEAMEILAEQNIHIVISDIMMPVMDGIELCKKIKKDLHYSHIPMIFLTAKNTLHSKIEGLEVGIDAYIEKPFEMEHLQAQIKNLLENRAKLIEYIAHSPLAHIKGIGYSRADINFLEQLNTVIFDNIADMEIDVDKLAKMMFMSRATFYRKIKGLSDLTPNELVNLTRLKKSAELLAEQKYKINEVASMVGYSLASNFASSFHKQFGVSPSEYVASIGKVYPRK